MSDFRMAIQIGNCVSYDLQEALLQLMKSRERRLIKKFQNERQELTSIDQWISNDSYTHSLLTLPGKSTPRDSKSSLICLILFSLIQRKKIFNVPTKSVPTR